MNAKELRALALLVLSGACSLRSLDHLKNDENGGVFAGRPGSPEAGGSAGATSTGGVGVAGSGLRGGAGGSGGSSGGTGGATSGAGGTSGGTSGAGGSGGAVSPAGGSGGSGGIDVGDAGENGNGGEGNGPSCLPGEPGCPPLPVLEIPYVLRPGQLPSRCIDMSFYGVDDGTPALQYYCAQQINQVFWAEDHGDGYVSFRNALSGKCLDVAGVSQAPDAPVQQWTCIGSENQLFLPEPASEGRVKLVAKHSGLVLDVQGAAPMTDLAAIVQNVDDGSPDMTWTMEVAEHGTHLTLGADDRPALLLRQDGEQILLEESAEESAEWKVVPGLAHRGCVSLASRDDTTRYLRQVSHELLRQADDGSDAFAHDATFCFRPPFVDTTYFSRTLESEGEPGYFLARVEGRVVLAPFEDSAAFRTAATWQVGQVW